MTSQAAAYLFRNGNAVYFDEDGNQMVTYQKLGLCGLHAFHAKYPEAPVYWSVWREHNTPIPRDIIPWLLRHIRQKPSRRPL